MSFDDDLQNRSSPFWELRRVPVTDSASNYFYPLKSTGTKPRVLQHSPTRSSGELKRQLTSFLHMTVPLYWDRRTRFAYLVERSGKPSRGGRVLLRATYTLVSSFPRLLVRRT